MLIIGQEKKIELPEIGFGIQQKLKWHPVFHHNSVYFRIIGKWVSAEIIFFKNPI